uniref:FAD/NAD(P)-binding domain-containing protein n=1 Tax=Brassica oleracea TaxID=3712 RepID=A0A3P6FC26_BRAOL|nr:unnamed protein product [Brassica oleracea]
MTFRSTWVGSVRFAWSGSDLRGWIQSKGNFCEGYGVYGVKVLIRISDSLNSAFPDFANCYLSEPVPMCVVLLRRSFRISLQSREIEAFPETVFSCSQNPLICFFNVDFDFSPFLRMQGTTPYFIFPDGDVIGYDYLVIATGHNDLFPKTRQENLSQYQTEYEKIRSSKSVLIVGGGPSGVELAAEISVQLQTETKHTGLQEERLYTQLGSEMAIVSLGRKDSLAQFPFATGVGCLPGLIKSKDLFVGKTRNTRGLNPKLVQD